MKIISMYKGSSTIMVDHKVFERVEEIVFYDIKVVRLEDAQPGDYVKTHNGYYIPLLKRYEMKHLKKDHLFVVFEFPKFTYKNVLNKTDNKLYRKPFVYSLEPKERNYKFIPNRLKYFTKLLAEGVDIYQALSTVYPRCKNKYGGKQTLFKLLQNEDIINYMVKEGAMKNLVKELENVGVTIDTIMNEIKECIEQDANPSLKKFGIQFAWEILKTNQDPKANIVKEKELESLDEIVKNKFETIQNQN